MRNRSEMYVHGITMWYGVSLRVDCLFERHLHTGFLGSCSASIVATHLRSNVQRPWTKSELDARPVR